MIDFPRPEQTEFDAIVQRSISRRGFLRGTAEAGLGAFVIGAGAALPHGADAAGRLQFEPVAANTLDTVTVPNGFSWHTLVSWGDPLWSEGAAFDHATRGTGASQALAVGDNNDGMELYAVNGDTVIAVNNEYVNRLLIYGNRVSALPETADDVRKGKAGHGVSLFEVRHQGTRWVVMKDSRYNRRITADTPMEITGPARGHDFMKTAADDSGTRSFGTWNNCGSGRTPWGTYLACEENFNGYFSSSDPRHRPSDELARYGIGVEDWGYAWALVDERFDISKHPNEPNRAGYVVEIDPTNPGSMPKKRTALGRFKHENAAVVVADNAHVVVYLGDDERGEFLYRFVSAGKYVDGANNADRLEDGRLYAAEFDNDGRGRWIELTPRTSAMGSKAEICIHTRQAASAVGATTMDRPEWVAVNPHKPEVYCCLTNNSSRGLRPNKGGDATPVGGPNPRPRNQYGQIVRWRPDDGDHTADGFAWDLYLVAGNPTVHTGASAGSDNINAENMFNSPDGLAFDNRGGLWIQTDGAYSDADDFAGHDNNQMLYGDPETGEIRRFLVGPRQCEVTGLSWSPDRKTMFVGIQHPGERGDSHFPRGGDTVPRSSIVAITRDDGAVIG